MADAPKTAKLQDAGRGDKRTLILSEAIALFNAQGYFDTRLEDVATRLGTAKTSISYHFKSKEALLFEAYSATCSFAEAEIKLAADAPTGLGRVLRWVRAFAQAQATAIIGQRVPLAVISDPAALREGDEEEIASRLAVHAKALRQFLEEGQQDGSIRVTSIGAATFFLLSIPQWIRRWLENVVPTAHDDAIDALCDLLEYGLCEDRTRKLPSARPKPTVDAEDFLFNREARNKMKLEAFLRIGTRHLNRRGFRNLSVNEVAADLGVTRGSFYYHFDDKEALLQSCVTRSLDMMEETLTTYREGNGDAATRLHLALTSLFEGHLTDLNPLLRQSLYASLSPKERPVAMARSRRITSGFGELIALGMADGSMRPLDLEAVEHLVCGAIFGATRQRLNLFGLDAESQASNPSAISAAAYFEPLFCGLSGRP